jgi:hypothetical protein
MHPPPRRRVAVESPKMAAWRAEWDEGVGMLGRRGRPVDPGGAPPLPHFLGFTPPAMRPSRPGQGSNTESALSCDSSAGTTMSIPSGPCAH